MLTAALSLVGHGTFTSLTYQDRMEAFYAAEAGVVYAIEQLEAQGNTWQPSSVTVEMPNGRCSFELGFSPSVNNLENPTAVDGPRGAGTVPPDSADLIVTGKSGSAERTIEVIVQRRGSINIEQAVYGGGRIRVDGNANIYGIKDIYDYSEVDADIHSNYDADEADVVIYDDVGTSMTDGIHGDITTVSDNPAAISISGGATVFGETKTGEPKRPLKKFDVSGIIDDHSGGNTVPAPDADGVVALVDGDFYHNGDLTIV